MEECAASLYCCWRCCKSLSLSLFAANVFNKVAEVDDVDDDADGFAVVVAVLDGAEPKTGVLLEDETAVT